MLGFRSKTRGVEIAAEQPSSVVQCRIGAALCVETLGRRILTLIHRAEANRLFGRRQRSCQRRFETSNHRLHYIR